MMSDIPQEVWWFIGEFADMRSLANLSRHMRSVFSTVPTVKLTNTAARMLRGNVMGWLTEHHACRLQSLTLCYNVPDSFTTCSGVLLGALARCNQLVTLGMNANGPLDMVTLGPVRCRRQRTGTDGFC